ncbi:MAG: hypothetical protein A3E37_02085 [Candidatus Andersenbacteria bacterium RIFCSPHIGHO2_12_FULL_46_9]|nr:MAG: hypothetical protein A3B76_01935 [Candidatus Andersenbacteria bacterium RIFCSPHIGHO2_02_FULL_46_16]OGY36501.1 MAG: hypothetical protein A3I08_00790 [Candidatus Andersenbacteria bacterium RIFCSPLOWO2_02_FULL_46_11]OGY37916.1 MAG: hypothetical protein A3E37_02085 [Candidatus Andersenbacteria bacterium RIFCSPHIGHO2_12_FULL_46_9]OGY41488.1 MAG: hypothetical protein A3G57_00660 [Candidatus Andersenbacteria bacterium RIFCSPLOWO2_12_FULL_45_8]HBE90741.1 hypothetical protein [Candidatus Anderse
MMSGEEGMNNSKNNQAGGVMLLVLIIMIIFIVIASATLRYVIRQSHETIDQEQEEQAFNAADSGVSYVYWLLDPAGGQKVVTDIQAVTKTVYDDLDAAIGTFTIDDIVTDTNEIEFTSTGRDIALPDRCQVIQVRLRQVEANERHVLTDWDNLVGYPCS